MQLTIRGAGKEVGRSCIELESSSANILFDCGLKLTSGDTEYPLEPQNIREIDAVFISHAHLDHTGSLPLFFHKGLNCGVVSTPMSKKITKILLNDSHKIEMIEHHHPGYGKDDIMTVMNHTETIRYNEKRHLKNNVSYEYIDAGHIPGSAMVLIEIEGKKVLYSGDYNNTDTHLLNGFRMPGDKFKDIDVMIIEATYGADKHPDRSKEEEAFLNKIEQTLNKGGSVVIPAFAIGRAQEVMLTLRKRNFNVPIFLDGMARKATEFMLAQGRYVKDAEELAKAYKNVKPIKGRRERQEALNRQAIVITTSGMMTGGPIIEHAKHVIGRKDCAILLTGYQTEGSGGRQLLDTGKITLDEKTYEAKCFYKKYVFSAHAGQQGLQELIKTVKPKVLIINHGEERSCEALSEFALQHCGTVFTPDVGDVIELDL